jgi:hypothetical protein
MTSPIAANVITASISIFHLFLNLFDQFHILPAADKRPSAHLCYNNLISTNTAFVFLTDFFNAHDFTSVTYICSGKIYIHSLIKS